MVVSGGNNQGYHLGWKSGHSKFSVYQLEKTNIENMAADGKILLKNK